MIMFASNSKDMKQMSKVFYLVVSIWMGVSIAQPVEAQKKKNSLLWEISGNGLTESSYLYGTIHIICPDDFELGDHVNKAFASTKQLVMELNMSDPEEMSTIQQLMMSSEPIDYKGLLTESQYKKLDQKLTERMGAGMNVLKAMKPFALSSIMQLTVMDCAQPASYETTFMEMASDQGIAVSGLETGVFQMSIFDEIPLEEQISWITEFLDNEAKGKKDWKEMLALYKAQDVEGLGKILNDSPEYKKYEDELLTKRNQRWIPQIAEMAKEKSVFVAVGAAHLGGKKGVIRLLKAAGYKVKPVTK